MTEVTALSTNNAASVRDRITQLRHYIDERIIDQEALTLRLLIALLADGHLLVEGAPGLAKTTAIKTLAEGIEGEFHRIQFTPDLLPADLTGTEIYRPQDGTFHFPARPDLPQPGAGRRDQPRPGQGAVGPARSHGRASGHRRPADLSSCRACSW